MRIDKFMNSISAGYLVSGRYRAYGIYRTVLRRVCAFYGKVPPSLRVVFSAGFLRDFREHLLLGGLSLNTISFYFSTLHSIYVRAVEAGYLPDDPDLFSHISYESVPTGKRAISAEAVSRIHAADLSEVPRLERCRDLFMLSLYLQGMPFVDLAHLRKSNLQGNSLVYQRQKTGGMVRVSIIGPVMAIIEKYAAETSGSPYLLPLITLSGADGHRQYQSALRRHNRQLKDLAEYLGLSEILTSYVTRHTWATIAYHGGIDVGVVSQGMGHHTEKITRIYLSSFGQDRLKEANLVVLRAILRPIIDGEVTNVREEVKKEIAREFQAANRACGQASRRGKIVVREGLCEGRSVPGGKWRQGTKKCPSL